MTVDPSPEASLVLDLVNTRDLRTFVPRGHPFRDGTRDDLGTTGDLRRWLVDHALLEEGADVTTSEQARILDLRTSLRRALDLERAAGSQDLPPFAIPLRVEIDPREGPRVSSAAGDVDEAIARICAAALRTTFSGEWWRLRICAAEDCQWAFFDHSKPGRGRYCSPDMCGNRVKTRAYRQRRSKPTEG